MADGEGYAFVGGAPGDDLLRRLPPVEGHPDGHQFKVATRTWSEGEYAIITP